MKNDKILSLLLFYKGKMLDNAREKRDIMDNFAIGSDKNLHWQILDNSFPKKHMLIKKSRDTFKMILRKGMVLSVKSGDQVLDESALRSKNYLKGNELVLDKGMTGKIDFSNDWAIAFEYIVPWKKVLTEEDRRIIHQYQRFPEMTSQQKLSRNLFIIAFLLLLIGGFIFERYYIAPVYERTLAQRVIIDYQPVEAPTIVFQEAVPTTEEPGVEETTGESVGRDFASIMGFNPGAVSGAATGFPTEGIQLITYSEQIATTAGGPGGGGPGAGPGGGPGSGIGSGASSFDATATGQRAEAGNVLGGLDVSQLGLKPVDPSILSGQTGIEVTHVQTTAQLAALARARQRAISAGLQTVTEEAIESAAPEVRATLTNIRQFVDVWWRQVEELYNQERQKRDMYGGLTVTLYFARDGRVEAADIQDRPGSFFTDEFKAKATEIMMGWRIPSTQQLQPYQFRRTFMRN